MIGERVEGIDVSAYQATIDYKALAESGRRFAIVKASEGLGYSDPAAQRHLAGLRAVGMLACVYAFLRPDQGHPREQVQRLWACSGDVYPGRFALDLETRPAGMTSQEVIDFAEEAAQEVETLGAAAPVLYLYPDFARRLQPELSRSLLARCDLWMADYSARPGPTSVPHLPLPWKDWAIWQYSGQRGAPVPGVVGPCDCNLFHGDEASLRRWFGLPEAA